MEEKLSRWLNEADLNEIKDLTSTPPLVKKVLCAVALLTGRKASWRVAKSMLADDRYCEELLNFDPDTVSESTLHAVEAFTQDADFEPGEVAAVSMAAAGLCEWALAATREVQSRMGPGERE